MSRSSFLRLPRELRDRIYDFLFPWETITPMVYGDEDHEDRVFLPPSTYFFLSSTIALYPDKVLAIFLVSHENAAEAKQNFYANTTFSGFPAALEHFLCGIGDRKDLIRSVEINEHHYLPDLRSDKFHTSLPSLLEELRTFSRLRSVRLLTSRKSLISRHTEDAAQYHLSRYNCLLPDIVDVFAYNSVVCRANNADLQSDVDSHECRALELITIWSWAADTKKWTLTKRTKRLIEVVNDEP